MKVKRSQAVPDRKVLGLILRRLFMNYYVTL